MSAKSNAAKRGTIAGRRCGYERGYADGYAQGRMRRRFALRESVTAPAFEGTSIIIPTHNKLSYVQECIESIVRYTQEPYELIVIDNASDDGTAEWLRSAHIDRLRMKVCDRNIGFAGAVNQGLHMAAGSSLLILNNDTVVTRNWLTNMLTAVMSDHAIGIVGPVTNYISGMQQIETNYTGIKEMHQFAETNNVSDPSRWKDTVRITGFCMLMRRDVFRAIGYFDEGFEIGNFEDDDYCHRARFLGYRLVVAEDAFIHHYGSVSMRHVQNYEHVNARNETYFSAKWTGCDWRRVGLFRTGRTISDFYPTETAVASSDGTKYWIIGKFRYAILDGDAMNAVHLSQLELEHWPLAGSITVRDIDRRIARMAELDDRGKPRDGAIFVRGDNKLYQYAAGKARPLMNDHAYQSWLLDDRPIVHARGDAAMQHVDDVPIIAPCRWQSNNL